MPKIVDPIVETGSDSLGEFRAELLSDAGGLTQFGAFTETLMAGSFASELHWHSNEDEMVYVLDGLVTLHEGDSTTELRAGDAATFKAGTPVGHCLENRSSEPATYLVIGTRTGDDLVTYPKTGDVLTVKDGQKTKRAADGTILSRAPYHGA